MKYLFKGVATALITPFSSNGINFEDLEKQIERQQKAKIDALVFLGTTGEAPTISRKERREIIKFAVNKLKGKIPIIIGTGSNCTQTACELTYEAKSLGADGALIVTPYYNRCEQDGLIMHYEEISKHAKFPFIVYNVPKRTGVNVEPSTYKAILSNSYAVGIKEANTEIPHLKSTFKILNNSHAIYCGTDELTTLFLANKAMGTISVASNVIPFKIKEFVEDFKTNYEKHNKEYLEFFKDFFALLSTKINPITIKCLSEILYNEKCFLRLPLTIPDKVYFEFLKDNLSKLNLGNNTIC